jgi:hypothetical protein
MIVRGRHHDREGRVTAVYRKKWVVHIERITQEKANRMFYFLVWYYMLIFFFNRWLSQYWYRSFESCYYKT